jgi:curved DNA-binding protein CbpA
MMDAFELLGLPRKLEFSENELRAAFREAGKRVHPDAGGCEAEFAKLQEAFLTLASPSRRLKHWLALTGRPGDDRGAITPGLMELFGKVGEVLQRADAVVRKRDEAKSALARAMLEGETHVCREAVEAMIAEVETTIAGESSAFPKIEAGEATPEQAGQIVRNLAFLEKWRANLRERFSRLV